jgi:hypothetical protein
VCTAFVDISSWPNPTNPAPGIAEGLFDSNYGATIHHQSDPAVLIEDGGLIATIAPNRAQNYQNVADEIEIHCGYSPERRGSANCITIKPGQCQQVWNILQEAETGKVRLTRSKTMVNMLKITNVLINVFMY